MDINDVVKKLRQTFSNFDLLGNTINELLDFEYEDDYRNLDKAIKVEL